MILSNGGWYLGKAETARLYGDGFVLGRRASKHRLRLATWFHKGDGRWWGRGFGAFWMGEKRSIQVCFWPFPPKFRLQVGKPWQW
jgi:hypothetical protein